MKWKKFTLTTTTEAVDYLGSMFDEIGIQGMEIEDNIPLTEEEKNLDYGFYDAFNDCFISETGAKIEHQPKIFCSKGIATLSGISYYIERELIIDRTLLDFKK